MNKFIQINRLLLMIVALFVLLLTQNLFCTTMTSVKTGPWSDPDTWGGTAPTDAKDDVIIANTHIVTLGASANPTAIVINSDGTLVTSTWTLTVNGAVANAGTFTMSGGKVIIGGAITGSGTFTTDASTDFTLNGTGSAVTLPSAASFSNLKILTITKTGASVTLGRTLVVANDITCSGDNALNLGIFNLTSSSGKIDLSNSAQITSTTGNLITTGTGDIILSNASSIVFSSTGGLAVGHDLTIGAGNSVVLEGGVATVGGDITANGIFTTNNSDLHVTGATNIASGGTLSSTGGTKLFSGIVTNSGTLNLAATTFGVDLTNSSGTTTIGGTSIVNGILTVTTGSVITASNNFTVSGATNINSGADFTSTGGTKNFAAIALNGTISLSVGGIVNVNGILSGTTGVLNSVGTTAINLNATSTIHDVTNTGDGNITVNATFNVTGNFNNTGSILTTTGTSTVTLSGTQTSLGTLNFSNTTSLTISGAGIASLPVSVGTLASLTITKAGGEAVSVTGTGTLTVNGIVTLNGAGAFALDANNISITNSTLSLSNSASITSSTGNIITTGTGDITLTNTSSIIFSNTGSFTVGRDLIISSSSAFVTLAGGVASIGGNLSITGTFTTINSNLSVTGTTFISASTGTLTSSSGTKIFTGTVTNNNILTLTGTTNVNFGTNLVNSAGTTNLSGATVSITGTITRSAGSITTSNGTDLTLTGASVAVTIPTTVLQLNNMIIDKTGEANSVILGAGLTLAGNLTVTNGSLNFNSKTVIIGGDIASNGGSIILSGATVTVGTAGSTTGGIASGNYTTSSSTILQLFGNDLVVLPSGFDNLSTLTITKAAAVSVTLYHNLTVATTITLNSTSACNLVLNSYTLETTSGPLNMSGSSLITALAGNINIRNADASLAGSSKIDLQSTGTLNITAGGLNLSGSSSISAVASTITVSAGGLTSSGINTSIAFSGAGILNLTGGSGDLNVTAGTLSLSSTGGTVNVDGAITLTSGATLNTGSNNLNVTGLTTINPSASLTSTGGTKIFTGTVTNIGTLNLTNSTANFNAASGLVNTGGTALNLTGATVDFNGTITDWPTTTTTSNTTSITYSNSAPLTLPNNDPSPFIGKLIIDGGATVKLDAASLTTFGTAPGGGITLTMGNLDLNGKNAALTSDAVISETLDYRIINDTQISAYIKTASLDDVTKVLNSGIGIKEMLGGTPTGITVKRYPESRYIPGGDNSVKRIYYLDINAGTPITSITLAYNSAELKGNTMEKLILYEASSIDFKNNERVALINTPTSTTMLGSGGIAGITGRYYAFSVVGRVPIEVTAITGDWNNPNIWSPVGIPTETADVIIPTDATVTIPDGFKAKANKIEVNGSGSLLITGADTWLEISTGGNLTVNSTSPNAFSTAGVTGTTVITIPGNLSNTSTGTINLTSDITSDYVNITIGGTFTNTGGGTITTNGGADYGTHLILNGTTTMTMPILNTIYSLTVNKTAASVYQGASSLTIAGTNTLDVISGSYVIGDSNITIAGTTKVKPGAILNANYTSLSAFRTYSGDVTVDGTFNSSGPRISSGYNNTFGANVTIGASGILNLNYSKSTFTGTVKNTSGLSGALLNTLGAYINFGGIVTWTNLTLNTNSNTDITFNGVQTVAGDEIPALSLKGLTFLNDAKLAGNITLYGDFLNTTLKTTTIGTYTFSVYGKFNNPIAGIFDASGSTLNFYGTITSWGANQSDFKTTSSTTLNILSNGSIADLALTGVDNLGKFTLNRAGESFTITGLHIVTFESITLTSGTLVLPDEVHVVSTTTTIGSNGKLDLNGVNSGHGMIFNGDISGTGTIVAIATVATATAPTLTFSGAYSFSGVLATDKYTDLIFTTAASDVDLNSSITDLSTITFNRPSKTLTLNNDLKCASASTGLTFVDGSIKVNGHTLTLPFASTAAVGWDGIDGTESSTLIFTGNAVLTNLGIIEDETTNFDFRGTTTLLAAITQCNNLTISGTLTTSGALEIWANLNLAGTINIDASANYDITIHGDFSNSGTLTATGNNSTLTLYGSMQGSGSYGLNAGNTIVIRGTSSQFNMPYGVTTLGTLTLNRASGMKINSDITLGTVSSGLVITSGDLDLNGYVITLGSSTSTITETAGNSIINTGASSDDNGYISTIATVNNINAQNSGIGTIAIEPTNSYTIRRYPKTIPVPGVGLSTSRIYRINPAPESVTLQYDNTELNSSASDLKLYTSDAISFSVNIEQTNSSGTNRTVNENTPTGKGKVAYSEFKTFTSANDYYALASVPGNGGVMYTYSGADNGYWNTATNWTPNGVPTKVDQVVIGPNTIVLKGEGNTFECKTLLLNHPNATLIPFNNTISGDNVNLRVMGNINLSGASGAEILSVNGNGRLNLIIGDGTTVGVSSTITVNNDYVNTSGIWLNNLTINMADVKFPSNYIRISGDVTLLSNCAVSGPTVGATGISAEFWGGINAQQIITIPGSSNLIIQNARFDNNANVTTPSDFELKNQLLVKNGSTFIATNGTALFSNGNLTGTPWNVENGGTLKLWNVEFNSQSASNFIPLGTVYIKGNFYQYNTDAFSASSGTVIFENFGQKEIVNTKNPNDLVFYNLQITTGSNVITSNSWQVSKEIDVKSNASLIADNGDISFVGSTPMYIKNASSHTLEFNNLNISTGIVYTSDSWKIKGNLVTTQSLIADNGTITFDNEIVKSITSNVFTPPTTFYKLLIADGSKLTTLTNHNFTIANNASHPTGSGIEIVGSGEFYVGSANAVTTFDAGIGLASGYSKTITKSSTGKLEFGNLVMGASPNNEVSTSSDFTITGSGASAYNNAGAGGKFTATSGNIIFTGAIPQIASVSPAVTQFYGIKTLGSTVLSFPNLAQEILIAGNITIDGISSITYGGNDNKTIFNGINTQTIGGTSTALIPISLADIVINKSDGTDVLLEINLTIGASANHELTLVNGILNLGSKVFNCGSNPISRINGIINGNSGTYNITFNHQNNKLEDVYFIVNGNPTLYNLTVNAVHTTANDLTVNGTLNLNTTVLTIGSSVSASSPIKLILNGNLIRNAGLLEGNPAFSRLVLQGTGTVANGLSNRYFTSAATATTVQLELARQDSLGGNLNIADNSNLRINTGINSFDIGANTLTFNGSSAITMLSGGIKADVGTVVMNTTNSTIPASMFRNNIVKNLTLANIDLTLASDLTITGTLAQTNNNNILTKDNKLTFGPDAILPTFSVSKHIVGNLKRTVKNTATIFSLGNSSEFFPVTMKFANGTSSQLITTSIKQINPVYARGGNADNAVLLEWTFTPEGSTPSDSLNLVFEYPSGFDAAITPASNSTFPAKWMGSYWQDYRNSVGSFSGTAQKILTMASYPLQNSEYLAGKWAVFSASANTNTAKDAAISVSKNKIVVKDINPNPVLKNNVFNITVELQDQSGFPKKTILPFEFEISEILSGGSFIGVRGLIPAGSSSNTLSGLVFSTSAVSNQIMVDTSGSSIYWNPGLSKVFPVLPVMPAAQAHTISFSNVKETSMTIDWIRTLGNYNLVVIKADTLLLNSEYPISGTTYYANTIIGAASSLGGESVVYNGIGTSINLTGLSPNTNYNVYVFTYDMNSPGNERYRTTAASGNPKSQKTSGSYDDDISLGTNNTRETSKTIGTQTPFLGTIKTAEDVDWFNFTVTSASPNIRGTLILTSDMGNYNIELYNMAGRRMRRGIRLSYNNEAQVINDLPSGTYTVKVMGINGAYSATKPYSLKITTSSSEIFSTTP